MTEAAQLRKCSKCRCNILLETYFSKNRKGEYKATCNGCLAKTKKVADEMPKDKFKCSKTGCNYACSTNSNLKIHIKAVHDKIKDVQCGQCDYKCYNNSNLKNHIKGFHCKIRDFQCSICDFKGFNSSNLKQHIKAVHNKVKDFQCSQCDFKCSTNGVLTKHIKAVHNQIKDVQCHKCDYKCYSNSDLKTHIKQVHDKIKDFLCSNEGCDYKCSTSSDLKKHTKTCVGNEQGSSGEVKIKKVLNEMKIDYQYNSSHELKNRKNNYLRWDFIITDYDEPIFIEFDGKQHFEPVKFWGGIKGLEKVKEYDKIKNDYCNENGYLLLRIPYTEYENIEKLVVEFIRDNTTWGAE